MSDTPKPGDEPTHNIMLDFSDRPMSPAVAMIFPAADEKAQARALSIIKMFAEEHDLFVFATFDNPTALPPGEDIEGQLYVELRPDTPFDAITTIPKRLHMALKATHGSPVLTSRELRPMAADHWVKAEMNRWALRKMVAKADIVPPEIIAEATKHVPQTIVYHRGADKYQTDLLKQLDATLDDEPGD